MTRNRATGVRTSAAIGVGKITASGTLGFAAALVLTALGASTTAAQDWPTKAIRAIVPLTAGSATDMIGRTVLDQLSQQLGQPIVVENRPGAGNTIGMATAARSDADGYTILINSSSHTIVPATYGNLPFDTLRDFTPVAQGAAKSGGAGEARTPGRRPDDADHVGIRKAGADGGLHQYENRGRRGSESQLIPSRRPWAGPPQ